MCQMKLNEENTTKQEMFSLSLTRLEMVIGCTLAQDISDSFMHLLRKRTTEIISALRKCFILGHS